MIQASGSNNMHKSTLGSGRHILLVSNYIFNQMKKVFFISVSFFLFLSFLSQGQGAFFKELADSTLTLTYDEVIYDPAYFSMSYPNGDVPQGKGVCTDVIIRAYRKLGIDLQKEVHEDMNVNFAAYPNNWGLTGTDKNIDHRRVPNLMKFFERHGIQKKTSYDANLYVPGDIVCWNLYGGITHIGLVVNQKSKDQLRYLIVHNIGSGQVLEDCLFDYRIIGHYSYKK